jgi:REP element-mobilizing transposase RayT
MSLWRLYYHIIWATKNRYPYLTIEREKNIYPYIIAKAESLKTIVHAIGGIEDHIHIVVSIPPQLSISEFVKNVKGSSSHYFNQLYTDTPKFAWQEGYGVFSLGRKQLDHAVNYVNNQKDHHQKKTIVASLEEISETESQPERIYPRRNSD